MNGKVVTAGIQELICTWDGYNLQVSKLAGLPEVSTVKCLASSTLTGGEYFELSTPHYEYAIWYSKNGQGYMPASINKLAVKVEITSTDTATQVATKTKEALNKLSDLSVISATDTVTITGLIDGPVINAIKDISTGFTFTTTQIGKSPIIHNGIVSSEILEILDVISINAAGGAVLLVRDTEVFEYKFHDGRKTFTKFLHRPIKKTLPDGWLDLT